MARPRPSFGFSFQQLQWDLLHCTQQGNQSAATFSDFTLPPSFINQHIKLLELEQETPAPSLSLLDLSSSRVLASLLGAAVLERKMGRGARPSVSLLLFSLGLVLLCFTSGSTVRLAEAQKTWCMAKPSSDEKVLAANINYACSNVSCAVIQPGGPCYTPNNLLSHTCVAMNLYYAANGRNSWNCYFANSGIIVKSDPSYGSCTYY